nr:MAG TPA: hypothetical protein [Caudoviricetes sp.]
MLPQKQSVLFLLVSAQPPVRLSKSGAISNHQ